MAFIFPLRDQHGLFFPTLHIHDGEVHDRADFDHMLYAQHSIFWPRNFMSWEESPRPAGMFAATKRSQGLIDETGHVYRKRVSGERKNEDIVV